MMEVDGLLIIFHFILMILIVLLITMKMANLYMIMKIKKWNIMWKNTTIVFMVSMML